MPDVKDKKTATLQSLKEEASSKKTKDKKWADIWECRTLNLRKDYYQKLKDVAYWERKSLKDVTDEAFERYFSKKTVHPRPKK
ncbi:MAG: hypothetical protein KAR79_02035 [Simkaniaceae bacterium]|nr:hypothetical protein [Simkaniaceae bacterium]